MSSLSEYLDFVWEETHGVVHLAVLTKESIWKPLYAEWPRQRKHINDFVAMQTAEGNDVYTSPAIWQRRPEANEKYSKKLFLGTHVLWVEFDGNAPQDWQHISESLSRKALPITLPATDDSPAGQLGAAVGPPGEAIGTIEGIPYPSWINQSSSAGHEHVYWKLDNLLTNAEVLENINRTLALQLKADNCWDATRVLRPPDTTNYGIGKDDRNGKTYPVFIEQQTPHTYTVNAFQQSKDFRPLVKESLGKIPTIREVLAKREWDEELWRIFNSEPEYKKRSDQLMLAAYYAAESGFTDEEIYAVVDDFDQRLKRYTNRNDRESRLIDLVERARAKHPISDQQLTFEGLIGKRTKTAEAVPEKQAYTFQEMLEVTAEMKWLVEGLLPRGGYGFIAGQNGIGKSQLGIRLAECLIQGIRFLNMWDCIGDSTKVMFLSLEMGLVEIKEFYKNMNSYGTMFEGESSDRFITIPIGETIPLDREEGYKYVEGLMKEYSPDVLIIDSLSLAMQGSFTKEEPVLAFNKLTKRLRAQYDVAIVIIHHNRKGQDKKYRYNELDDLYGSRFLPQDTSFVLMLDKPKAYTGDELAVNPAKIRFSAFKQELMVQHRNMNFEDGVIAAEVNNDVVRISPKSRNGGSPSQEGEFGIGPSDRHGDE